MAAVFMPNAPGKAGSGPPDPGPPRDPPSVAPPRIVFASPRFVVVDKPAWMLSVPGKGEARRDCVAVRVGAMFPGATGPLIVHRLDMETSGLMVLGLDADAQRELSRQFEARLVEKEYAALLDGIVTGESGEIDLPLRADIEHRPIQVVDDTRGRPALTRWRVLARETDRTRVEFRPLTGRTHQLRVHAATTEARGGLGHAIIGDGLYGGPPAGRLMLHARRLAFLDPDSGRRLEFECPTPF
ncbi:MAG: RluA family pseudouridine synthase [Phycisphaerales bacterium]